ncbi:hypothetical protein PHO31112_01196 [Pandoraea horticolens]|uniref:Uncharacterized protein n=1 Tax=Pandoraea horticolens TaxID=2508298 RepID=A0A5E4T6A4_9BURK|nr:hypothetical protein [Pandoraea horticolens]VVD82732.1 hypothetical protein PHO31112_01196 [Pandoraea horticolens]
MGMHRKVAYALTAALTCLTGFTLHVLDVDILEKWLAGQPMGPSYSLSVTLLAALTSIEVGIGLVLLYGLIRPMLKRQSLIARGLVMALLLLASQGRLLRQLVMDQVVGGLAWQGLIRDLVPWLIWMVMCLVLVWAYERFIQLKAVRSSFASGTHPVSE